MWKDSNCSGTTVRMPCRQSATLGTCIVSSILCYWPYFCIPLNNEMLSFLFLHHLCHIWWLVDPLERHDYTITSTHLFMYSHVCTHTHIHTRKYTHTFTYRHVRIHVHTRTSYTYACICTHARTHTQYTHAYMLTSAHTRTCTHTHTQYTHAYTLTSAHTHTHAHTH